MYLPSLIEIGYCRFVTFTILYYSCYLRKCIPFYVISCSSCYVPKGASRKQVKVPLVEEPQYKDAMVQTEDTVVVFCEVGVQTVEAHTAVTNDASIQTDSLLPSTAVSEVEVQTEKLSMAESSSQTNDMFDSIAPPDLEFETNQLCAGNNDDKFFPLTKKHKDIFMNAKGSYLFNVDSVCLFTLLICMLE